MKIRVISLLLALTLALSVCLLPAPASAAGMEAAEIESQIRNTYRAALRGSGRHSFNGYCGSMVNWQTYLLGIDTHVIGSDGKDEYDRYVALGITSGGYKVKAYPAGQYTLKSALNAITADGTQDAYNILVGFQRTNTQEGSIYGHALLIHAIIDGTVYFAECFNASLDGVFWAEGAPIHCSIDTFCDYYNRWTVFDGVAYFGIKSYADVCAEFGAGMYAMAPQELTVYEEPWDVDVNTPESTGKVLEKGEKVQVDSLWETPGGAYFYELSGGGYVEAERLVHIADCYEDVLLTDVKVPGALRRGVGYALRGVVSSRSSLIESVEVVVYDPVKGIDYPEFSGVMEVNGKSADLSAKVMDRQMVFRNLPTGSYCISIRARVKSNCLENGEVVSRTADVTLWHSQFRIITDWNYYADVTFDGNGGEADLDRLTVKRGETLEQLPAASRVGYILTGWALDPEGTLPVTEETVIEGSTVLYAQWRAGITQHSGWKLVDGTWCYLEDGAPVGGWFAWEGVQFCQSGGKLLTGWKTVDGINRYFNDSGALCTGWQQIGSQRYYLKADGSRTVGWYYENTGRFYFGENGAQQTEWVFVSGDWYYLYPQGNMVVGECTIDGAYCLFQDDGILQLAQRLTENGSYYVVYDRQAAVGDLALEDRLLLG